MRLTKTGLLATTFIAGLMAITPSIASAQTTTQSEREEQDAAEVEDVVVTGSRIRRNEFNSSQPIQVITSEQAALEGTVDTSELLQSSSAANTATQINNFFTGYVVTGGPGVNTVSLRGLGAQRTLVLINGRRAGPAGVGGTTGPVDLNTIPSSQIERVEVLTDGASSIYGSDAVAGVINIITKTSQDGGTFSGFVSQPFESGGEEYRANISQGWTFDRGYLTVGADYYERSALTFGDREEFACPQDYYFSDPDLKFRADVVDPVTGDYKCGATINSTVRLFTVAAGAYRSADYRPLSTAVAGGGLLGCDLNGFQQTGGGYTALPVNGVIRNCSVTAQSNAVQRAFRQNHVLFSDRYASRTAVSPVTRASVSAFGGFDLTPNTEVFGEFLFNRRESSQHSWRQLFPNVYWRHPNFISDDATYAQPIILKNTDYDQSVDYTRAVLGVRGTLNVGSGFDWELTGQYSKSDATYGNNFFYADRVYATSGTSAAGSFAAGANATQFAATGCVTAWLTTASACPTGGVNYFRPSTLMNGEFTAEEEAFLVGYEEGTTTYEHAYLEGVISGDLFTLPAGPVGAALGFQYRREELDDTPGAQARASNLWGQTAAGRTAGKDTIKELFVEFDIPLIQNVPLIDKLTLNLSSRYSDYDSYGDNTTYKAGLNWQLTPEYRIRASYGTAFRAPALYELYLANQTSFATLSDPCVRWGESSDADLRANCLASGIPTDYAGSTQSTTVVAGGGIGVLEAETADTFSGGLIWTPSFADFNIALDYFKVTINDQVSRFGSQNIVSGCYFSQQFSSEPLCQLLTRNAAGAPNQFAISQVRDSYINVAEQMSEGLDLNVRYRKEFGFGDLTLGARASYILDWTYQLQNQSAAADQLDYIGYPDWVGGFNARFDRGDWTFYYNVDLVPEVENVRSAATTTYLGQTVYVDKVAEGYANHNISIRKRADKWTFQLGVNNLFDENAPLTSSTGGSRGAGNVPLTSQYDYVGRRAFVSITRNW